MKSKEEQTAPKLRFKGYTDAWQQRKFSEISKRIIRKNKKLTSLRPLTISAQYGLVDQTKFFNKRVASKDLSNYLLLFKGDFAYNKSYSSDAPYGAVKQLVRYKSGVVSSLYFAFKINEDINDNFVKYYFDSDKWHKNIYENAAEGARNHGLLNITAQDFFSGNLKIAPSKFEQDEIGKLLSKLDETITLLQRKKTKYEELKTALLQNLFPKKGQVVPILRFKNFQNDWQQSKLEDRLEINSGKDYKGLNKGKIPVYGTGGYMLSVDKSLSEKNAIGIGRKGTINKPQLLHAPFWTVDTLFYLTPKANNNLIFLFYLFQKINWSKYDESTGLPSLSKKTINNIKESTPSNSEQKKIGNLLSKIDTVITLLNNQLSNLENLKQFLLQNMFI